MSFRTVMITKQSSLSYKNRFLVVKQDIEEKYFDAGMFYFCKTDKIYEYNSLVPKNTSGYVINSSECQDIDTIEDWEAAQIKFRILHNV